MDHAAPRRVAIPRGIDPAHLHQPGPGARLFAFGGETMGTTWSVRFHAPRDFAPGHVLAATDELFARINAQMSLWAPDSDICRFNAAPAGAWVTLPEPFFSVLAEARAVAEETAGAFDPTLGALAARWGFGAAPAADPPSRDEAAALAARSGWRRLELDASAKRALQPGGLALDLNAIAKGDAVDRLGALLDAHGLRVWLAEIGGELKGRGRKPDGGPWWAEVETGPEGMGRGSGIIVALTGLAVATSGAYRRARRAAQGLVCHTIDPASGAALGMDLSAVTVLDARCARADALATALFVMGAKRGAGFAAVHDIPALFTHRDGETLTPALSSMLED